MASIAGGMESDMSDSDCDLVCPTSSYTGFQDKISSNKNESKTLTKVDHNQPKIVQHKNNSNSVAGYGSVSNKHTKSYKPQNNSRRSCIDTKTSQLYDDLRYAIMQGSLDITKEILEKGVRVDTILKAGWTGLMHACSFGRYEIVSFLLENKADPNYHKDSDLFTPLMAVCASKKEEEDLLKCCHLLLEKGAHVNVHERYLTTPLMFAVREGHMKIVETLLENGADVHMSDNKKCTALSWAASCGFGQIVRLLLKKGADPQHVDANAQTPADLAYSQGHKEIASLLEKSTATQDHVSCDKEDENSLVNYESTGINQRKRNSKSALSAQSSGNFIKHGELEIFLTGLGFQELISLFQEHQLNLSELLIMNEEELEKIGIQKFGDRKKILEASKAIHKTNWETTSLTNLKQRQYISCPDAVAMMSNIAKHLKYISSTVIFVRQQIQSQPRILELSQDSANVHNLLDEMEESLKNVRFLNDELRFLKLHLDKVQDNEKFIPADLIVETVNTRSKTFKFVLGISIVSVAVGAVLWKNPNVLHSVWSLNVMKSPFPKFSIYFPRISL